MSFFRPDEPGEPLVGDDVPARLSVLRFVRPAKFASPRVGDGRRFQIQDCRFFSPAMFFSPSSVTRGQPQVEAFELGQDCDVLQPFVRSAVSAKSRTFSFFSPSIDARPGP